MKAALLRTPGDARLFVEVVRSLEGEDDPTVFRWFRRLAVLADWSLVHMDGDVVGRAMIATRAVDPRTLFRILASVQANHPIRVEAIIFFAAALVVTGRLPVLQDQTLRDGIPSLDTNFRKVVRLLNGMRDARTARDAFTMSVVQHYFAVMLERGGFPEKQALVMRRTIGIDREFRDRFNEPGVRIFSHKFTFTIGHMVLVAFFVKGMDAGLLDFRRLKLWECGGMANAAMRERLLAMSPNVEVVPDGTMFAEILAPAATERVEGREADIFELCGIVADRTGDASGGIWPRPTMADPEVARFLDATGLRPGERIVTLHCRESGHRRDVHQDLRCIDIDRYLPAIRWLAGRGYKVVRLGDWSMKPLPAIDGVVDYALSPLKSQVLDVLLPGVAAFHIGCSSGLSLVPLLYGTPCLFLNWYPGYVVPWGRRNWTVMKPLRATDGRRVTGWGAYTRLAWLNSEAKLRWCGAAVDDLEIGEVTAAVQAFTLRLETGAAPFADPGGRNVGRTSLVDDAGGFVDVDFAREHADGASSLRG